MNSTTKPVQPNWQRRQFQTLYVVGSSPTTGTNNMYQLKPGFDKIELKAEFRRLCKLHHPDTGGDATVFLEVQKQYDMLFPRAVEKRPVPLDNKKTFYRVTQGPPRNVTLLIPESAFADGGTIIHMFTDSMTETRIHFQPNQPLPSTAKCTIMGKIVTFTLQKDVNNIW